MAYLLGLLHADGAAVVARALQVGRLLLGGQRAPLLEDLLAAVHPVGELRLPLRVVRVGV